jgi:hypothetical protein
MSHLSLFLIATILCLLATKLVQSNDHLQRFKVFGKSGVERHTVSRPPVPQSSSILSMLGHFTDGQLRSPRVLKITPILLFFLGISSCNASPLNPQPIALRGPFFQGWLVRTTDHTKQRSFIFIVGSFSSSGSAKYDEHYLFCGVETPEGTQHFEAFPEAVSVTISGSPRSLPFPLESSPFEQNMNITWSAQGLGHFRFSDEECVGDFKLEGCHLKFCAKNRLPWSNRNTHSEGPEGKLGYVPHLLPCHYFVHSVGSKCRYSLQLPSDPARGISGRRYEGDGFAHIEGNHGTNFPKGWVWSEAIAPENAGSFSLTGGMFEIGPISPVNFIFFLRIRGKVRIFRTTELDKIAYDIKSAEGIVSVTAESFWGEMKVELRIMSRIRDFRGCCGPPVYIPTPNGFTNKPGALETYTAEATAVCFDRDRRNNEWIETDRMKFPLTALEFGGCFQNIVLSTGRNE